VPSSWPPKPASRSSSGSRCASTDLNEIAGLVSGGELGRVYQLRASLRDAAPPPFDYLAASGGYFWDGAIHLLDLARWLIGEIDEVGGVVVDVAPAVGVLDVRALPAREAERGPALAAARVDAARDHLGGLREQSCGAVLGDRHGASFPVVSQ
jgi:predicted dehydrogenase